MMNMLTSEKSNDRRVPIIQYIFEIIYKYLVKFKNRLFGIS
jgi:hypothetical protein